MSGKNSILLVLLLALASLLPASIGNRTALISSALAADNPFRVEVQGARIAANEKGSIEVLIVVPQGFHVYRDMMDVKVLDPGVFVFSKARFPKGVMEEDPADPGTQRESYHETVRVKLPVSVPATLKPAPYDIDIEVSYQGCKANLCFMPQREKVVATITVLPAAPVEARAQETPAPSEAKAEAPIPQESEPSATIPLSEPTPAAVPIASDPVNFAAPPIAPTPSETQASASSAPGASAFEAARSRGILPLLLFVFGAGFLVSLTPCVLPMIPITMGVIGARAEGGRLKALALSGTYVFGLALVYTTLGVVAGLTGSMFGGWMQSIWVVGGVALFFAVMGLSMFGVFDLTLPSTLSSRLNRRGSGGFLGAFVVGMVGALVAGPCSGPVIASLMVLIGQKGEVALGAALMMAFSLGMGVLFLLAGLFSSTLLRPGAWMVTVKKAFGVVMWLGAIYFIKAHLPLYLTALLTSGVLLTTAVFGWPGPNAEEEDGPTIPRLHKLYGVVAGIVGAWLLLGTLTQSGFILPPLRVASSATEQRAGLAWASSEPAALEQAKARGLPVVVDFTAAWCAACHELEAYTYTDPRVVELSKKFIFVKIDATNATDPEVKRLVTKYGVSGLPAVFFLSPSGEVQPELNLAGYEKADDFLARMQKAIGAGHP